MSSSTTSKPTSSKGSASNAAAAGSKTMAELMAKPQTSFYVPQKGELVKGKITKLTPSEVLVDINAKTEAVVLEKERKILRNILSNLKIGDTVEVSILNPESDLGNPVVSLRRFLDNINWEKLAEFQKNKQPIEAVVTELTRGGFLVETPTAISGFLPNSQSTFAPNTTDMIGKKTNVFVWELNRPMRKIIFSQKPVLSKEDFEKASKHIIVGAKITATISNITPFGVFVALPKDTDSSQSIDGLIHISEISWEKIENIEGLFTAGQAIETMVIGKDLDAKRIDLSIKRLELDPFEAQAKSYKADQKVTGKVTQVTSSGVIIDLGEGIEGMIRKEKIPVGKTYEAGEEVNATVFQVDTKRRKIVLIPVLLKKSIGYR